MKTLVIAEKPSVGRDIARVLKCAQKADGYLYSDTHVVSWAIGHLTELFAPEDYDSSLKTWKMATLPIIPAVMRVKPVSGTALKQYKILKTLMTGADISRLVCATDSGREGELIFRYIYDISGCDKPFDRLWISSMTDAAIKSGFENLRPGADYDALYTSAKCRSEADWLVGINATRAYTVMYGCVLSVGRVQTPTLAIIVNRQKEIDAFVPEDYWEVRGGFRAAESAYGGMWFDPASNDTRIKDKQKAEAIAANTRGKAGVVESVDAEEKRVPPERLYDLTDLQKDCNRKFGFTAQKTLSVAQDLYEKRKLITYPRTDSRYLTSDLVPRLKTIISRVNVGPYAEFAARLLDMEKLPITSRVVDNARVSDHHAIIPTEAAPKLDSLSPDETKVYDLVVRRFLAAFYPNYVYNAVKVVTLTEGERFATRGSIILSLGWMELYKSFKDSAKKEPDDESLPNVKAGDTVMTETADVLKKKTQPPKPYTEATLLSAMENAGRFVEDDELKEQMKDSGLGTPATRAAIIERLLDVGYLIRKGKALSPTEKGIKLIGVVPPELKTPETTGKWERGLSSIAKGTMTRDRFMGSIERYVRFLIDAASKADLTVRFPEDSRKTGKKAAGAAKAQELGQCPLCKKRGVFENSKSFYCGGWKDGCKFSVWKDCLDMYGRHLDAPMMEALLKDGKIARLEMILPQTKEKCRADLVLKPEGKPALEWVNVERV